MTKFKLIQKNKDYLLISDEPVTKDNMSTYLLDKKNNEIVVAFEFQNFENYLKIYASTFPFGKIALLNKNKITDLIIDREYSLKDIRAIFEQFKKDKKNLYSLDDYLLNICSKWKWEAEIECNVYKSSRDISDAKIGDFVLNNHNQGGIIYKLDDDPRVEIGDYFEVAQTSDNGHETLSILGYKIIDKIEPIIEYNYINILSLR